MRWISKSGIEYTDYGINIFKGCPHNCSYCWAFWNRKEVEPRILPHQLHLLYEEAMSLKPGRLLVCTATDPYPYESEWVWLTSEVLKTLLTTHHYILILTKGYAFRYDVPLFKKYREYMELGITLTTLDDEQAAKFEPKAVPPSRRVIGLQEAHNEGVKTFGSIEPWIPNITDPQAIISKLSPWVDRWIIGRLNYRKVPEGYYEERLPGLIDWMDVNQINYLIKKELKCGMEVQRELASPQKGDVKR